MESDDEEDRDDDVRHISRPRNISFRETAHIMNTENLIGKKIVFKNSFNVLVVPSRLTVSSVIKLRETNTQ